MSYLPPPYPTLDEQHPLFLNPEQLQEGWLQQSENAFELTFLHPQLIWRQETRAMWGLKREWRLFCWIKIAHLAPKLVEHEGAVLDLYETLQLRELNCAKQQYRILKSKGFIRTEGEGKEPIMMLAIERDIASGVFPLVPGSGPDFYIARDICQGSF